MDETVVFGAKKPPTGEGAPEHWKENTSVVISAKTPPTGEEVPVYWRKFTRNAFKSIFSGGRFSVFDVNKYNYFMMENIQAEIPYTQGRKSAYKSAIEKACEEVKRQADTWVAVALKENCCIWVNPKFGKKEGKSTIRVFVGFY